MFFRGATPRAGIEENELTFKIILALGVRKMELRPRQMVGVRPDNESVASPRSGKEW